jgi:Glucoamylase and related glycosyl hydrolases
MLSIKKSVEIIKAGQSPGGAYTACPTFSTYAYSWLRDGSFIADAMLRAGESDSTLAFLRWCSRVLVAEERAIVALEGKVARGERLGPPDFLPTRFSLDGSPLEDDWPNFQIDGYGTWLWCLARWHEAEGLIALAEEFRRAAELTIRYLDLVWRLPNFDCWEEFGDKVHVSTLACVYGGLSALESLLPGRGAGALAEEVRAFVRGSVLPVGRYPKYLGATAVDASLLWLALPFGLVELEEPAFAATVARIETTLLHEGGVKRYAEDSYYGGGQWIILSAWLGWYYAASGRRGEAEAQLAWIESTADTEGRLPEQVPRHLNDPAYLPLWEGRWGKAASPLLWSHAMHIVLVRALSEGARS